MCENVCDTPTPSGVGTAITKTGLRDRRHHRRPGQIPIDLEAPRDFVSWRFSDARNSVPNLLRRAGRPKNLHKRGHPREPLASPFRAAQIGEMRVSGILNGMERQTE